jgi:hypothetical protein
MGDGVHRAMAPGTGCPFRFRRVESVAVALVDCSHLAAALKFSECMRNHGITDYPDPRVEGGAISMSIKAQGGASNLNPTSPQFQAAQKACSSLLGKGPGIVQTCGGGAKS